MGVYFCTVDNFNPRSPHRERLEDDVLEKYAIIFQSTLPSQGATEINNIITNFENISIHAPLTGSDDQRNRHCYSQSVFQSTLPSQGATLYGNNNNGTGIISIHAPLTGSDVDIYDQT